VLVKITVTLRHDLVGWAERTARKMRISRNRLFSTAITEFLERRRTRKITERLNQVYAKESSRIASILHSVQIRSLGKDRW
jgi:metal-responsive CopG/Arc/MetJ family transcriptional regulator